MTKTLHLRLQYNGVTEDLLDSVALLVEEVSRYGKRVAVILDVSELPLLADARLLYEACKILTNSVDCLSLITDLIVKCKPGLQESLARSAVLLLSVPFSISILAGDEVFCGSSTLL